MTRKVLIVSPRFPPLNAADHQRVRMCLPHLAEFGWKATILSLQPKDADTILDHDLLATVPEDLEVETCKVLPLALTRCFGLGSIGLRALPYMIPKGRELISKHKFDLVFVSTTAFPVMYCAARWRKDFGVSYVLDYQDPWINTFYDQPGAPPPPGGWFKYRFLARPVGKLLEPPSVKGASHIICVSDEYTNTLSERYGLQKERFTTLPFASSETDFEIARSNRISQNVFDPNDGLKHWVSIGAATKAYTPLIRVVFEEFKELSREFPMEAAKVRFHFVGTNYSPDASRQLRDVSQLATSLGLDDQVEERPMRIPYLSAMKVMAESDAVLAIGNTDPAHTASKIYPVVLSTRPFIAYYHQSSSALDILETCKAGHRIGWSPENDRRELVRKGIKELLLSKEKPEYDRQAFSRYTARGMTERLCGVFDRSACGRES